MKVKTCLPSNGIVNADFQYVIQLLFESCVIVFVVTALCLNHTIL